MSSLPNYKARLERASRNQVPVRSATESFKKFKWFTTFLVILFPIYPSLAQIGTASQTQVGDYDESSIITAFTDTDNLEYISESGLVVVSPETLTGAEETNQNTSTEQPAAIPESNVRTYTVVEHDDIIKISKKYNIAAEVILWSNNLSMSDTLVVGQVLKIPPVSGIVHALKPGETVSDIAKQYNVSVQEILDTNNISDARKIQDGTKLMIPGAVRPEPKVVKPATQSEKQPTQTKTQEKPKTETSTKKATPVAETKPKTEEPSIAVEATPVVNSNGLKDRYAIKFTGLGRGFVAGNCTWHVARNKAVTWRGNANQWIRNARAQGVPTGKTPIVGAIVQFSGHGYNAYYGHVGIVTDIQDGNIIVSDMNYRGLYEVTIRKVPINHPAIDGYIYVD